jgi:hypothetical protein
MSKEAFIIIIILFILIAIFMVLTAIRLDRLERSNPSLPDLDPDKLLEDVYYKVRQIGELSHDQRKVFQDARKKLRNKNPLNRN